MGCMGECKPDCIMPIREELSLSEDFYESLDEQAIDVTQERIDEAWLLSQPLNLFHMAADQFESSKANANDKSKVLLSQESSA